MVEINFILLTDKFKTDVKKVRDKAVKEKLQKPIAKVAGKSNFGKPLRYGLRGEWSIYLKPFRLIYKVEGDKLILLRFENRKKVYD
jgi:mRNA-degrading endonuclease RelE of RelBE toxin-antitoxin system